LAAIIGGMNFLPVRHELPQTKYCIRTDPWGGEKWSHTTYIIVSWKMYSTANSDYTLIKIIHL